MKKGWILTLVVNLNPLMRFDGYYLFSDYLGIKNLQERAFAMARWKLRSTLFGLELPAPEQLRAKTVRTLVIFAWATWIYRFFLFLAIALLVYYFFFKLAGLLLMLIEGFLCTYCLAVHLGNLHPIEIANSLLIAAVTVSDRGTQVPPQRKLFLDPLIDQDVSVNCHT